MESQFQLKTWTSARKDLKRVWILWLLPCPLFLSFDSSGRDMPLSCHGLVSYLTLLKVPEQLSLMINAMQPQPR